MGKPDIRKMNGIEERISDLDLLDGIVRKNDKKISKIYEHEPDLEEDGFSDKYSEFPKEYRRRSLSDGKLETLPSEKSGKGVPDLISEKQTSENGDAQSNNATTERKPVTKIRYRARRASHYHVQWAGATVIESEDEGEEASTPRQRSYSDASHHCVKLRSILKYPKPEKPTCVVFVHGD